MENWDEVRTAYYVVRQGTVSGAAEALGVHHATVIRHIDTLEGRLGVKLFQRHPRGYTPTEAGEDLARVARATDDQMAQLQGRIKGRGTEVSGELVVTTLPGLSERLMPLIASFERKHPGIRIRFLTSDRVFKLEYGEAHVAIRAGVAPPDGLDNVVQPFLSTEVTLFASPEYIARYGEVENLAEHRFIGPDGASSKAPFYRWLLETVPADALVFRSDDSLSCDAAVRAGVGIGFLARDKGLAAGLIEVLPPDEAWKAPLWLVTHVDLHRTAKVQSFLKHLKENVATLDG